MSFRLMCASLRPPASSTARARTRRRDAGRLSDLGGDAVGVLPHTPLQVERGKLKLKLRGRYKALAGERVFARLKQLGRLVGHEPMMEA